MSHDISKDNRDKVIPLETPQSVQAQASAWLAKLDDNKPSEQDLQAFKTLGESGCGTYRRLRESHSSLE